MANWVRMGGLLIVLACGSGAWCQSAPMTLAQCVAYALAHQSDIHVGNNAAAIAGEQVIQARSNYYPQFRLATEQNWVQSAQPGNSTGVATGVATGVSTTLTILTANFYDGVGAKRNWRAPALPSGRCRTDARAAKGDTRLVRRLLTVLRGAGALAGGTPAGRGDGRAVAGQVQARSARQSGHGGCPAAQSATGPRPGGRPGRANDVASAAVQLQQAMGMTPAAAF